MGSRQRDSSDVYGSEGTDGCRLLEGNGKRGEPSDLVIEGAANPPWSGPPQAS